MADNEHDVMVAVMEIVEADTSTGSTKGITVLTSKASPLIVWGDRGMNNRPIITWRAYAIPRHGSKDALNIKAELDIFAEANNSGLEEKIGDRLEAILTQANLSSTARTNPVDVAPTMTARRSLPELEEGRRRLLVEFDLRFNRS